MTDEEKKAEIDRLIQTERAATDEWLRQRKKLAKLRLRIEGLASLAIDCREQIDRLTAEPRP